MDITGFFTSISEIQVYRVFHELGYQPLVAFELARLVTYAPPKDSPRYQLPRWSVRNTERVIASYNFGGIGYLPQGAPTSPMLSNLAMSKIDTTLEETARKAGLKYTRYSDDLTFSTRKREFNRQAAANTIGTVTKILLRVGFLPQHRKTVVVPPGARKVVLGLLVDGTQPRLPTEFRSNLRQHIYYLEKFGPIEHAKARRFDTVFGLHNHISGLINFAKMVDRDYAVEMMNRFEAIEWPL